MFNGSQTGRIPPRLMVFSVAAKRLKQLAYPEFSFESEAKDDSLIGVHQTKAVEN